MEDSTYRATKKWLDRAAAELMEALEQRARAGENLPEEERIRIVRQELIGDFRGDMIRLFEKYGILAYGLVVVFAPIEGEKSCKIQAMNGDTLDATNADRDRLTATLMFEFKKWLRKQTESGKTMDRSIILE